MLHKLESVELRYNHVSEMMSNPTVIGNQNEFKKLSKEYAELTPIIESYRKYKKLSQELAESKAMLAENDADLREMAKSEITRLEAEIPPLEETLKLLLMPKDPNDDKNIILEIRAGTGGDEASIFVGDLYRMYERYAQTKGWKIEMMSMTAGNAGGFKEIIAMVQGDKVYSHLKFEGGVHRVQRVPATETQGRIHTSTITVAILPEVEDIELVIPDKDLRIDVYRSSGKGGQSVNTTDSAVRIVHLPTGITVAMQDEKSQHKNKDKGMKVLRARILEMEQAKQDAALRDQRLSMVGTGDRSERIRTYNFPQERVTDHRAGITRYDLTEVMNGRIDDFISQVRTHFQAEALKAAEERDRRGA
jgi:peptide chain release factor 1